MSQAESTQADTGPVASTAELPEMVRDLSVAPALVEAGITHSGADRLAYILDQVYFAGDERVERLRRFAVLIVLSTMIASFGLLADSVAVVIGAMLVAPLMTPILGTSVSLVLTEPRRLLDSIRTVLGGALGAVSVGWLISFIAAGAVSNVNLPGEILGRTNPGLLDLGVAVSAGLAAGYLMVDRKAAASAAGVAIAVALVPPLATVGICLELGYWPGAAGALLLFGTNLVAIVLSAGTMVLISEALPRRFLRVRFRELRAGFAVVVVAAAVIAIPLTFHTRNLIEKEQFDRLVADAVEEWDPRSKVAELITMPGSVWAIDLTVTSPASREPAWRLADIISAKSGELIDLDLAYVTEEADRASTR